jgi:uncharacterized protein
MSTVPTVLDLLIGQQSDSAGQALSHLPLRMANRHGLIAGATGTGKTMTLRRLAEQFSHAGVPVFLVDVKGDLSGFGLPGVLSDGLGKRLSDLQMTAPPEFSAFPTVLWDVNNQQGHGLRTTVTEVGPQLLSRLLNLNDTQQAVLTQIFDIADDEGLALLDLKDLQAMLNHADNAGSELSETYGNLPQQSIAAIKRQLGSLGTEAEPFFGEPALAVEDLLSLAPDGRGTIHVLNGQQLMLQPAVYATVLLWLLSELFETLPEIGDQDKPKLVLFFDEAHLLFNDMPKALTDKLTQVVRLIRSKGVGVYFVTQNPLDLPEAIRGQLGHRLLHALRVFSPKEAKAVRTLADSYPSNPALGDLNEVIPALKVGEALVSVLDEQGQPTPAQRIMVHPSVSWCGALSPQQRQGIMANSPLAGKYDTVVDRASAFELLKKRQTPAVAPEAKAEKPPSGGGRRQAMDPLQAFFQSAVRAVGSELGRSIIRGVLGTSTGRRRR